MPVETRQAADLETLTAEVLAIARAKDPSSFLWFRGVANAQYSLVPKLMRDGKAIEEILERVGRLLTRFRQRSMAYWPSGYPQNDWEHLFAMQHYGMPTRLLDWSENLFVAAHFALSGVGDDAPAIWCFDPDAAA